MIKRLFPNRWARIAAWTGAAVAWAVSLIAVGSQQPATESDAATTDPTPATDSSTTSEVTTTLPALPESGLVVLRFTPVEPPPPQVITHTVAVGGGGGGSRPAPTTVPSSGS